MKGQNVVLSPSKTGLTRGMPLGRQTCRKSSLAAPLKAADKYEKVHIFIHYNSAS